MTDIEEAISYIESTEKHLRHLGESWYADYLSDAIDLLKDAVNLLQEQEKEIRALRLLVEWATDCDFGFDQFPDEYERYKNEITDMKYVDGMIHVAKRTLEDHGAFEER